MEDGQNLEYNISNTLYVSVHHDTIKENDQ
jgi:hypothetical protein